jgi:hypothetical protein
MEKIVTDASDPIADLDRLLHDAGAKPMLVRERMAPSTLYDADYHMAIVACAFSIYAPTTTEGPREMLRAWLKLLQFVAARPRLAPNVKRWAGSRRQADLETWRKMPRGYVGDQTHDAVVDLLVANKALVNDGDSIHEGAAIGIIDSLFCDLVAADLFATERDVISELMEVRVSKAMLGGG